MTSAHRALQPVTNNPSIIYQSHLTPFRTRDGLLLLTHIPIYSGTPMRLYKYLTRTHSSPPTYPVTILPPTFPHGNRSHWHPPETISCPTPSSNVRNTRPHGIAPKTNILTKNLDAHCIFNLFQRHVDDISKKHASIRPTPKHYIGNTN